MAHILKEKISLIINGGMSQTITFIIEYPINYSGGKSIIHISFKRGGGRSDTSWQSCSQPLRMLQQGGIVVGRKAAPKIIFPRPHGYPSMHIWRPRPILENRDSLGFPAGSPQPWLLLPFKPDTKPLPGQHSPEFRSPWELSTCHGSTDALGTWRCLFLRERKKKALIQTARGNSWRRAKS